MCLWGVFESACVYKCAGAWGWWVHVSACECVWVCVSACECVWVRESEWWASEHERTERYSVKKLQESQRSEVGRKIRWEFLSIDFFPLPIQSAYFFLFFAPQMALLGVFILWRNSPLLYIISSLFYLTFFLAIRFNYLCLIAHSLITLYLFVFLITSWLIRPPINVRVWLQNTAFILLNSTSQVILGLFMKILPRYAATGNWTPVGSVAPRQGTLILHCAELDLRLFWVTFFITFSLGVILQFL